MTRLFDTIAKAITSLGAVVFVMLVTISGMVFFSHTLFGSVFPVGMDTWERKFATWLMAFGWEATVLITTVNVKHVNRHIPAIMAGCSGMIVLFFIQAFDSSQDALIILERWFVGLLAATINYIYADLFYAKWVERTAQVEQPSKLNELQSRYDESQSKVNELRSKLDEVQPQLMELVDLRSYKNKIERGLICTHCKVKQESADALRAHKGRCTSNPNARKA